MAEKRLKRPRDPIALGKMIGDILTGQVEDRQPEPEGRNADAVEFARKGGLKVYGPALDAPGRYSPPTCTGAIKHRVEGKPDPKHISTSFVERQNLNVRMGNRRMTRLTNAFSKKAVNHEHMMAIYFMHYNFVRIHQTLKVTPAMAAGVTTKLWEMSDIVNILEEWEHDHK
jgi:hypothetical protein